MSNGADSILLVEDREADVILVQRAFQKANITIPLQVVNDGHTAIEYLQGGGQYRDRFQHPLPILILLDLKLPRRSGSEVLAWLRQQPILKRIPVVVLTTSREYADINHIYDLGVNAYIVKPVQFNDLLTIIQTLNLHWIVLNEKPQIGYGLG